MLIFSARTDLAATERVALPYDDRKRSRIKVTLASGAAAGIFITRGDHLRDGDRLVSEAGEAVVEVAAAPEKLLEAIATTPLLFARAAYHLGNRHVPVQVIAEPGGGRLRFQADHVLGEMLRGLGLAIVDALAPFEPEAGAYAAAAHRHASADDTPDLHDPGHGPHRSLPRIHEFRPARP